MWEMRKPTAAWSWTPASWLPASTPGGVRVTINEKPVVKGDLTGDGVIDSTDVMALFNAINSGDDLDATVADVNGDGVIDARDVMALYNIIKGND